MERAPSLCGVILAAGASTRMGQDKALLAWPPGTATSGETFLSAAIRSFSPHTEMVIVVAGKNSRALAPIIYSEGAFLVENSQPERGQFSSLQTGLQEVLARGRDAALITLVDRPPVAQATIISLIAAFHRALRRQKWAVVPEYQGKHGHPYLASREMLEAFLKAPSNSTAREVEHANQLFVEYVPVNDPLVTANVDTPQEYAALSGNRTSVS